MSCIGSRRSQISSRSALSATGLISRVTKSRTRVANFQLFGAEMKIVHGFACPNSCCAFPLLHDGGRDGVPHFLGTGFAAEIASQVFALCYDLGRSPSAYNQRRRLPWVRSCLRPSHASNICPDLIMA